MGSSNGPGFLEPDQRKFLRGEHDEELSSEAERQRRYRIRQRAKGALKDLGELRRLSPRDQKLIFDDISETPAGYSEIGGSSLESAIDSLLELLYWNMGIDVFCTAVERTVRGALLKEWIHKRHTHADISVSVNIDISNEVSGDELRNRLDAGEELTEKELFSLSGMGRLPAGYGPSSGEEHDTPETKSFEERVDEAKERMQSEHGDGTDEDS